MRLSAFANGEVDYIVSECLALTIVKRIMAGDG
jgi:hypothetical protein